MSDLSMFDRQKAPERSKPLPRPDHLYLALAAVLPMAERDVIRLSGGPLDNRHKQAVAAVVFARSVLRGDGDPTETNNLTAYAAASLAAGMSVNVSEASNDTR